MIAEYWAAWLGIELNFNKREDPRSATRHLGFFIVLIINFVTTTMIYRDRVVARFNKSYAHDSYRGLCPGKEHVGDAQIANLDQHSFPRILTVCATRGCWSESYLSRFVSPWS